MHGFSVTVDGTEYHINHNGDWSGEATIRYQGRGGGRVELRLPGEVLRACGRSAALQDAIAALENLE